MLRLTGMYNYGSSLPDGLDSEIALWGSSLSGGQRQRLVIARELLKKSDILLLDEPTAALDAVSARAVQDTIFRLFRGKTIIIVTHDLSLISLVDKIVVLNDGTIGPAAPRGTWKAASYTVNLSQNNLIGRCMRDEKQIAGWIAVQRSNGSRSGNSWGSSPGLSCRGC